MKISIITAMYNSADTLRDPIESVLAQTYKNIEYIVVDGVSKDNTLELARSYEPQFDGKMRNPPKPSKLHKLGWKLVKVMEELYFQLAIN